MKRYAADSSLSPSDPEYIKYQEVAIRLTQVIALATAWWGGSPGPRGTPSSRCRKRRQGPPRGRGNPPQYFTAGRRLTITGIEIFDANPKTHHTVGDPAAATTAVGDSGKFVLTAAADPASPTQVLVRKTGTRAFLVVQYNLT